MAHWDLGLFGTWSLRSPQGRVRLNHREQRLVAALALHGASSRSFMADLLWPDSGRVQGLESVRVSLWTVNHQAPGLLTSSRETLDIAASVRIDVHDLEAYVRRRDLSASQEYTGVMESAGIADLLQGWTEEWVLLERERMHQMRVRGLEKLAEYYFSQEIYDRAIETAGKAARLEPFREEAHRIIIRTHVSSGDRASAVRCYRLFSTRLNSELGVDPSRDLANLVRQLGC
jgi:DNA-binding SARP family transcriptional activator